MKVLDYLKLLIYFVKICYPREHYINPLIHSFIHSFNNCLQH